MDLLQTVASSLDEGAWDEIQAFLDRYGYLSPSSEMNATLEDAASNRPLEALRKFYAFYGIKGESAEGLARAAVEAVKRPRCGFLDLQNGEAKPPGCPWPDNQRILMYEVRNEPDGLLPGEAKSAIDDAIAIWNEVLRTAGISLLFEKKSLRGGDETVDVRFSWETEETPEIIAIIGTPIAHADFPPSCGVLSDGLPRPVVFNARERWAADSSSPGRFNIVAVAVHELGHILGLPHSEDQDSIMFPGLSQGDRLSPGDREALARLYSRVGPEILAAGSLDVPAHP